MPRNAAVSPTEDVAGEQASPLYSRYGVAVDSQSAREILAARMAPAPTPQPTAAGGTEHTAKQGKQNRPAKAAPRKQPAGDDGGALGGLGSLLASSQGKAIETQVMRDMFGLLGETTLTTERVLVRIRLRWSLPIAQLNPDQVECERSIMSYPLDRKLVVEFIGMFIFVFTVGMATNKAGAGRWRRLRSGRC